MSSFDDLGWRWYWHIHVLHSGLDLSFWFTSQHQAWRGLLKWNWLQQTCLGALHSIGIQNQWDASHTSTFPTTWEPFLDDSSIGSNTLWGILFKVGITGKIMAKSLINYGWSEVHNQHMMFSCLPNSLGTLNDKRSNRMRPSIWPNYNISPS